MLSFGRLYSHINAAHGINGGFLAVNISFPAGKLVFGKYEELRGFGAGFKNRKSVFFGFYFNLFQLVSGVAIMKLNLLLL